MASHGGSGSGSSHTPSRVLIEYAAKCAEQFVSLYYSASDSPSRSQLLPSLYLPSSTIVWNGNPIQGVDGVRELVDRMPLTRYEVQSMDCQPLGKDESGNGPTQIPSLLLTVTGCVTHHTPSSHTALPPSNAPASSTESKSNNKKNAFDSSLPLESLPRSFSQNFVLVNDPEGKGEGGIVVSVEIEADSSSSSGGGAKGGGSAGNHNHNHAALTLTGRYFVLADQFRFTG